MNRYMLYFLGLFLGVVCGVSASMGTMPSLDDYGVVSEKGSRLAKDATLSGLYNGALADLSELRDSAEMAKELHALADWTGLKKGKAPKHFHKRLSLLKKTVRQTEWLTDKQKKVTVSLINRLGRKKMQHAAVAAVFGSLAAVVVVACFALTVANNRRKNKITSEHVSPSHSNPDASLSPVFGGAGAAAPSYGSVSQASASGSASKGSSSQLYGGFLSFPNRGADSVGAASGGAPTNPAIEAIQSQLKHLNQSPVLREVDLSNTGLFRRQEESLSAAGEELGDIICKVFRLISTERSWLLSEVSLNTTCVQALRTKILNYALYHILDRGNRYCFSNLLDMVDWFVQKFNINLDEPFMLYGEFFDNWLDIAVKFKSTQLVDFLVDNKNISVMKEFPNRRGWCLFLAVMYEDVPMIGHLLKKGVLWDQCSCLGQTLNQYFEEKKPKLAGFKERVRSLIEQHRRSLGSGPIA